MNLKKIKILSMFMIFFLTVIFHFLYDLWPNFIFSILFPINESIWEHMKLIYSGIIIYGLIEKIILNKNKITNNNFCIQLLLVPLISIIIYLLIYLPFYNVFGEKILFSISLLFIVIVISQIISYYILKSKKEYNILNAIAPFMILIVYYIFYYLTYNPLNNYIFFPN